MRYLFLISLFFTSQVISQAQRQGMDRALFFAVNDYQKMTDLKNPVKNAQDLAAELRKRYGFLAEVVPNPTLETIENKIASYKRNYANGTFKPNGQLFIFFTGHGVVKGNNGYFMPSDADPNRPYASAIDYNYWRDEINNIDCKHILAAVDACHSITFDPSWKSKTDRSFNRPGEQFSDQVLLNHQSYRARLFFTSDAKGNQTPDRSTFAQQLLTGLRTHPATNGYMTSSELFASYLKKAAPTPGGGSFGADEAGSAFLFFRKPSASISATRSEKVAWQNAQQQNSSSAYRQYLATHPNGDFTRIARQKLSQLEAEEQELLDWQQTKMTNTPKAYQVFIQKHPNSPYREVAAMRLKEASPIRPAELDDMVFVKGGTFQMGSKDGESNETPHTVTLSDYYIARHEVTIADFSEFIAATNYQTSAERGDGSFFWKDASYKSTAGINWRYDATGEKRRRDEYKHPVIHISWYDAVEYCNWLSTKENLQKVYTINDTIITANWNANGYRLPTEAEWEYAARSRGKDQKWAGTSIESELVFYGNHYEGGQQDRDGFQYTSPVGTFKANKLGLFDMSGNVWEWCWDWFDSDYYSNSPDKNPKGPNSGLGRVLRGGSWDYEPANLRCANRFRSGPDDRVGAIGFRLSRSAP